MVNKNQSQLETEQDHYQVRIHAIDWDRLAYAKVGKGKQDRID